MAQNVKISDMLKALTAYLFDADRDPLFPVILKSGENGDYYNYRASLKTFSLFILDTVKTYGYITKDYVLNKIKELNLDLYITEEELQEAIDNIDFSNYFTKTEITNLLNALEKKILETINNIEDVPNYNLITAYRLTSSNIANFGTSYKTSASTLPSGWSSTTALFSTEDGTYIWQISARLTTSGFYKWLDGSVWSTAVCIGTLGTVSGSSDTDSDEDDEESLKSDSGMILSYIYMEQENKPDKPLKSEGSYDFSTGTLTPPKGWNTTYNENATTSIWYTSKTFYENTNFTESDWQPVALLIRNASDLLDATTVVYSKNVALYTHSSTKPAKPSTNITYDYDSEVFYFPSNETQTWFTSTDGFTLKLSDSDNENFVPESIWVSYNNYHSNETSSGWSDPVRLVNASELLELAKNDAEKISKLAISDSLGDFNKALKDLLEANKNVAAVIDSVTVLYSWQKVTLTENPTGDSLAVLDTTPTTEAELNVYTGSDYYEKYYKLGDLWYQYSAYSLELTTLISALDKDLNKLRTTVNELTPDYIRLLASRGLLDNVVMTSVDEDVVKSITGVTGSGEIAVSDQCVDSKTTSYNDFITYSKSLNFVDKSDTITGYFHYIYYWTETTKDENDEDITIKHYYRADYPTTTGFLNILADSLNLGVTNTSGKGAVIDLKADNKSSNVSISADSIVLNGDTIAAAIYASDLNIYSDPIYNSNGTITGNEIVSHLDKDGSAYFGKYTTYFDPNGDGFTAGGRLAWGLFLYDEDGQIVYDINGVPVDCNKKYSQNDDGIYILDESGTEIEESKPYQLVLQGIINAYAGLIGGWTIAGQDAGTYLDGLSSSKIISSLSNPYLYAKSSNTTLYTDSDNNAVLGDTKLILSPERIYNLCTPNEGSEYEAYALNCNGSAFFSKGFVRFESDGSGAICPGIAKNDSILKAEKGITWDSNGNITCGSNVKMSWNEGVGKNTVDYITTSIGWNSIMTTYVDALSGTFTGSVKASSFLVLYPDLTNATLKDRSVLDITTLEKISNENNSDAISAAGLGDADSQTPVLLVSLYEDDGTIKDKYIVNLTKLSNNTTNLFDIETVGNWANGIYNTSAYISNDTFTTEFYRYKEINSSHPEWNDKFFKIPITTATSESKASANVVTGVYARYIGTTGYAQSMGSSIDNVYLENSVKLYAVYNFNNGVPSYLGYFVTYKHAIALDQPYKYTIETSNLVGCADGSRTIEGIYLVQNNSAKTTVSVNITNISTLNTTGKFPDTNLLSYSLGHSGCYNLAGSLVNLITVFETYN